MKSNMRMQYLTGWGFLASGLECLLLGQFWVGLILVGLGAVFEIRLDRKTISEYEIRKQIVQMQNSKHWYRNTAILAVSFLLWQIVCVGLFYLNERYFLLFVPLVLIVCVVIAWREFSYRYLLFSDVENWTNKVKKKGGKSKRDDILNTLL